VIFNDAPLIQRNVIRCRIESTKQFILVSDDIADDFDDVRVILNWVAVRWHRQQCWSEAYGQIVWIHHVFIAEFRKAVANFSDTILKEAVTINMK